MVLQEPFLFSTTIEENIRYANAGATRAEVEAAAKAVGAHDFIIALPQGYDTLLEQRGANLSLGQRQLISFARALVADARILVLDEATANVDSYTELEIQRALARLLRSEEHTSELQSLMRISYAVFCLKQKKKTELKHEAQQ